jgi:hypothetical protein
MKMLGMKMTGGYDAYKKSRKRKSKGRGTKTRRRSMKRSRSVKRK